MNIHINQKKPETDFAIYLVQKGHSLQSIKTYQFLVDVFLKRNPNATEYKYHDIVKYFDTPIIKSRSLGYRNTILAAIKKYYDFLFNSQLRENHPCKRFFIKSQTQKNKVILFDIFTSVELEKLLKRKERFNILKYRNQLVLSLLIYQALTPQEICNLMTSHIDLEQGTIYIRGSAKLKTRHLKIHPQQFTIIEKYLNKCRTKINVKNNVKNQFIYSKLGNPISVDGLNYIIETYKPIYPDRNLNAQTIRQSVIANWLNEKKIPLEDVQLLAGHKWISSTDKYRVVPYEKQQELINLFHPFGAVKNHGQLVCF